MSTGITEEDQSGDDGQLGRRRNPRAVFNLDLVIPLLRVGSSSIGSSSVDTACSSPQHAGSRYHGELPGGEKAEPKPRCGRPDGKFPLCAEGRCTHREHWSRLRGKRGHAYFFCRYCGLGWRVPKPKSPTFPAEAAEDGEEQALEELEAGLGDA
eukprot:EG_transcript_4261